MNPEQILYFVYKLLHKKYTEQEQMESEQEAVIHDSLRNGTQVPEDSQHKQRAEYLQYLLASRNEKPKPEDLYF